MVGQGPPYAFTLIELLVVVAILLPALNRARDKARVVACQSNLHQIHLVYSMYATNERGSYPYPGGAGWGQGQGTCVGYYRVWNIPADLRPLVNPYVGNPSVFYCPSGGVRIKSKYSGEVVEIKGPDSPYGWNRWGYPDVYVGMFSYSIWAGEGLLTYYIDYWAPPHHRVWKDAGSAGPQDASREILAQDFAWADMGTDYPTMLNHPGIINNDYFPGSGPQAYGFSNMYYDGHAEWRVVSEAKLMAHAYGATMRFFR